MTVQGKPIKEIIEQHNEPDKKSFVLCLPDNEYKREKIKKAYWNMLNNHGSDFETRD